MQGFSTVDGFMDVNECVMDIIKYLANEPSLGLFFVQQHTQNAVPNLLLVKDKIKEKSHEMILHMEDIEESINMVVSMKDCGFLIADEMNKDIKKSLLVASTSKPKKGLIRNPILGFQSSSSWSPASSAFGAGRSQTESSGGIGYLSSVLNTAKQRAAAFGWSPIDAYHASDCIVERQISTPTSPDSAMSTRVIASSRIAGECHELLLPNDIEDQPSDVSPATGSLPACRSPALENFEKFKTDQESRLKEWLDETENTIEIHKQPR